MERTEDIRRLCAFECYKITEEAFNLHINESFQLLKAKTEIPSQ